MSPTDYMKERFEKQIGKWNDLKEEATDELQMLELEGKAFKPQKQLGSSLVLILFFISFIGLVGSIIALPFILLDSSIWNEVLFVLVLSLIIFIPVFWVVDNMDSIKILRKTDELEGKIKKYDRVILMLEKQMDDDIDD